MEEKEQFAPTEIVKDGKVTRRTFVKGAGWLTITSAIGASALGCAPAQKSESEDDKLAETGPVADPEEGFTYKSAAFVWLKKNKKADSWFYGLGFWTRGNAEICLLATKGHPKRQAANIHQFIISPIEAHSKKPDEAREKIVALMGDLPRVELFARQSPPGWDVWGNEVEPTIPDFWTKCPEAADQKEDL